jgi:hypothetical protein
MSVVCSCDLLILLLQSNDFLSISKGMNAAFVAILAKMCSAQTYLLGGSFPLTGNPAGPQRAKFFELVYLLLISRPSLILTTIQPSGGSISRRVSWMMRTGKTLASWLPSISHRHDPETL